MPAEVPQHPGCGQPQMRGRRSRARAQWSDVPLQMVLWLATAILLQGDVVSASESGAAAAANAMRRRAMRRDGIQRRVPFLPPGPTACGSVRTSSLRLRGGSSVDDGSDVRIEWGAASARLTNVTLLVFDQTAVLWRERDHGTLHLSNLSSGEPSLAFFPDPACVARASEAEAQDEPLPTGGSAREPLVQHVLWELLDHQPLTAQPCLRSFAYHLPTAYASVCLGQPPTHACMIGWRFPNADAAESFQQGLLQTQARLRHERLDALARRRAARRQGEKSHDSRPAISAPAPVGAAGRTSRHAVLAAGGARNVACNQDIVACMAAGEGDEARGKMAEGRGGEGGGGGGGGARQKRGKGRAPEGTP